MDTNFTWGLLGFNGRLLAMLLIRPALPSIAEHICLGGIQMPYVRDARYL